MAGESKSVYQQPFFVDGMDDDRSIYNLEKGEESRRPRPWFFEPPCADVRALPVSRKPMLDDLLRALGGSDRPQYYARRTRGGFFGHVTAQVPDVKGVSRFQNMYGCSNGYFPTKQEAEDRAADDLIRSLKRKYNFEVSDFNWATTQQYNLDRFDLWEEARMLKRKVRTLEERSDSLMNGWSTTLQLLKPVHQMASITRASAAAAIATMDSTDETIEVLNNAATVEEYIGRAAEQGNRALQRATRSSK